MSQHEPSPTPADSTPPHRYNARTADAIEQRWQREWAAARAYEQPNPGDPTFDATRPKFYCLDMFPYPSGAGLHVGHPEGYTATDIICRYKRMRGCNVLHPMGWDAFGLPAEQYAIQTGVHPAITTKKAIDNFRRQLQRFGFCYDWSRELGTIDPEYYKWTQWIFLKLYNSWFDEHASGDGFHQVRGRARPITDLVREFENGTRPVRCNPQAHEYSDDEKSRDYGAWNTIDARERRRVIDSYRLAYLSETMVNWCPRLGTVLANDEVIDGRSERGGHPVLRKPLRQWMFRITAYAQRLLDQLDSLDWPQSTKTMQREWIGRSEGAEVRFDVKGGGILSIFTTRPDTIFGATYMVVAPEHHLCADVLDGRLDVDQTTRDRLRAYVDRTKNLSELERRENKEKTGVFTGTYAINPATGEQIPIWAADYVLMGYGTGAIMAVPGHDERDFEFAKKFNLPVLRVVKSADPAGEPGFRIDLNEGEVPTSAVPNITQQYAHPESYSEGRWVRQIVFRTQRHAQDFCKDVLKRSATLHKDKVTGFLPFVGEGVNIRSCNSEVSLDGLSTRQARQTITSWLEKRGLGAHRVNYKLHDWTFSRQRYWGEPIPIVFDSNGDHYPVSESALPVRLPELADYAPVESDDPQPLLAKARDWARTTAGAAGVAPDLLPSDAVVTRECNTMPGSAGSSWYFLRYCDARNDRAFASREALEYWMNVDLYLGGSEHAVGHLLYSRFWNNVLFDLGLAPTPEPFRKLFHQGLITSFAYQRADKTLVPVDQVSERTEGEFIETATGLKVTQIVAKMSKSLKNVINPDDVIAEYGADTFRLYEMYMGPLDASKPWNPRDIAGCFRFLQRAWRVCVDEHTGAVRVADSPDAALEKLLHRLIKKVGDDIERLAFNTAIAAMIEFINAATSAEHALTRDQMERFLRVLSPFAPHMAEEVWERLGSRATRGLLVHQSWPAFDPAMLVDNQVEIPISVMGKVRARIMISASHAGEPKSLEDAALAHEEVKKLIAGREVKKVIAVPGRMVNLVLA